MARGGGEAYSLGITAGDYLPPLEFRYLPGGRWDAGRPKRWWTEQDDFAIQRKVLNVPTPQSVVVFVVVVMSNFPAPFDVNRFPGGWVSKCCEVCRSERWCGPILLIWYINRCRVCLSLLPPPPPPPRWDGWDQWHALGEKWNIYRILGLKAWREEITDGA